MWGLRPRESRRVGLGPAGTGLRVAGSKDRSLSSPGHRAERCVCCDQMLSTPNAVTLSSSQPCFNPTGPEKGAFQVGALQMETGRSRASIKPPHLCSPSFPCPELLPQFFLRVGDSAPGFQAGDSEPGCPLPRIFSWHYQCTCLGRSPLVRLKLHLESRLVSQAS